MAWNIIVLSIFKQTLNSFSVRESFVRLNKDKLLIQYDNR